jgi:hypothetical protein
MVFAGLLEHLMAAHCGRKPAPPMADMAALNIIILPE